VPATSSSTTTTTPKTTSTSSDTWIWIVVGVAAAAALALLIALLVAGSRRRRATRAWIPTARSALDSATAARDLLIAEPSDADATTHEAIKAKVGEAATMLDRVSAHGPDEEARTASRDTAEELRGLLFAIEAQRLLPTGRLPPTADQIAQADLQRRSRESELERAMVRLSRLVRESK
jgi:MYXO-CTERM domain-containing protein